jgi:subtilase family serine protease
LLVGLIGVTTAALLPENIAHAQQNDAAAVSAPFTQHVRDVVAKGQAEKVGPLPADKHLQLAIVLPLRKQADAEVLAKALSDPKSPSYRKFLSVKDFTDRFGPTQADYDALIRFVTQSGMTVKGTHANRLVLSVDAPVSAINEAFNVTMGVYKHPLEDRTFYSLDREPTANFGVRIWHIDGLDDFSIPRHASGNGSSPGGGFTGVDFRAAYSAGGLTGAGQSIGLLGGKFHMEDVRAYFESLGQPFHAAAVQTVPVDGADTNCALDEDCGELAIDIEQSLSMAPGVDSVIIYEGKGTAVLSRMASDNIARQLSTSIVWHPSDVQVNDPIFVEFIIQGQTLFAATGDHGSFGPNVCQKNGPQSCSQYPSEDIFVTGVGGTTLTTTGPGGAWASETAWGGSGGGVSTDGVPIPFYQQLPGVITVSNQGSPVLRNLPDVAGYADGNSYYCANGACGNGVDGTSFSSPRWAGAMALINQQMAENGSPKGVGWLNPILYALGSLNQLGFDFHDITEGNNFNKNQNLYSAGPGYDLATGWGSPRVQILANDLAGVSACWPPWQLTQVVVEIPGVNPGVEFSLNGQNYTYINTPGSSVFSPPPGNGWITPLVIGPSACGVNPTPFSPITYVNLGAYFNGTGIYLDSQSYHKDNGIDGFGYAYSRALVGTLQNMNGVISFSISNAPLYNYVRAAGQTITLPAGQYGAVNILATGVDGAQTAQTFTVEYSDGSTQTFTQSLSDWTNPKGFPSETIAAVTPYRNSRSGQSDLMPVFLYGYPFLTDATKTVTAIRLPNNPHVAIFAITAI